MCHVQSDSVIENGNEKIHYNEVYSLENFNSEEIVSALLSGELKLKLDLGVYASGNKKGKQHDNGTAFRVLPEKLDKRFDKKERLL